MHDSRSPLCSLALCLLASSCDQGSAIGSSQGGSDLAQPAPPPTPIDLANALSEGDLAPLPNACGDSDPSCAQQTLAAPFPLRGDAQPVPGETDVGVLRAADGSLILDPAMPPGVSIVWIANTSDLQGNGTASRLDPRTVREVARYLSVTCLSLKTGTTDACDGAKGCCSIDDWQRYQARKAHLNQPGHQAVQRTQNYPSRTGVDWNGDLFVSNRAFGGQSSVTKVAARSADCIDRNRNGLIDTSKDSNGDGYIQTDCNGDGQYDTLAGVRAKPCSNNLPQEFYGEDDECILWTSNTFPANAIGRPLALVGGGEGLGSADAWAGSYQNGNFVRIDGTTGQDKDDAQLPLACSRGSGPYGLVIDSQGIGWTPNLGAGKLCFFDTRNSMNVGVVRDPQWGRMAGYGVTLDRDQNIWVGLGVARYTPDRSNGFKNLDTGWWTQIDLVSGRGIAADSRSANAYFVYSCGQGQVLQIPASTIKMAKMDQIVSPVGWPVINMPCYGVGVDADQNVWGVDMSTSTRALVDRNGKITQPKVNGAAIGNNLCPKGDSCPNAGAYTYSDFTGFGLRNFGNLHGTYQYLFTSPCVGDPGAHGTSWRSLDWDVDLGTGGRLSVQVRQGATPTPDGTWSSWSVPDFLPPLDLASLSPGPGDYLQVEVDLSGVSYGKSPTLHRLSVTSECRH